MSSIIRSKWQILWLLSFFSFILIGVGTTVVIISTLWDQNFSIESIIKIIMGVSGTLVLNRVSSHISTKADREISPEEYE